MALDLDKMAEIPVGRLRCEGGFRLRKLTVEDSALTEQGSKLRDI